MNIQNTIEVIKFSVSEEIRKTIDASLAARNQPLRTIIHYHFGWDDEGSPKGKMLRPLIVALTCEAFGCEWQKALPAAAAIEFIHNFSLIHDDIEDGDETRHGKDSVWHKFGIPQAINTGDALIGMAFKCLSNQKAIIGSQEKFENYLANTIIALTEGQSLDIDYQLKDMAGINDYWNIVDNKTGSLIGESFRFGAMAAGADNKTVEDIYQLGILVGRAFQIQDDILGIWGEAKKTGKSKPSDLIQQKKTLPIILALNSSNTFKVNFRNQNSRSEDLEKLMELLSELNIKEKAVHMMNNQLSEAKVKLNEICSKYKNGSILDELIDQIFKMN